MEDLRELTVISDRVFLSFLVNQLEQDGLRPVVFDHHTGAALGFAVQGLGARVCVPEADYDRARWLLAEVTQDEATGGDAPTETEGW